MSYGLTAPQTTCPLCRKKSSKFLCEVCIKNGYLIVSPASSGFLHNIYKSKQELHDVSERLVTGVPVQSMRNVILDLVKEKSNKYLLVQTLHDNYEKFINKIADIKLENVKRESELSIYAVKSATENEQNNFILKEMYNKLFHKKLTVMLLIEDLFPIKLLTEKLKENLTDLSKDPSTQSIWQMDMIAIETATEALTIIPGNFQESTLSETNIFGSTINSSSMNEGNKNMKSSVSTTNKGNEKTLVHTKYALMQYIHQICTNWARILNATDWIIKKHMNCEKLYVDKSEKNSDIAAKELCKTISFVRDYVIHYFVSYQYLLPECVNSLSSNTNSNNFYIAYLELKSLLSLILQNVNTHLLGSNEGL